MILDYVPLLEIQRELHEIPRGSGRFKQYLRTIFQQDELGMRVPLLAMNPMGREHVNQLLDGLLALDAERIAEQAVATAAAELSDVPGDFKVGLVIVDDLKGGWTNRFANEFDYRFGDRKSRAQIEAPADLPKWANHYWLFGVLWSSEPASERAVEQAILTTLYRAGYVHRHGRARTLREMLAQEGHVLAMAGSTGPVLDPEDIEYTRTALAPCLEAEDMRTCIECLFGDAAARTLGFTPRGLSDWAGVALALHDARGGRE